MVEYCKEPVFNLKCIFLTLFLAIAYWFLPSKNIIVLCCILYFTYIALAWYDYLYECKRNLGPTYLSLFYKWLKPPESLQIKQFDSWCPKIKRRVLIVDLCILTAIILLILLYRWIRNNIF